MTMHYSGRGKAALPPPPALEQVGNVGAGAAFAFAADQVAVRDPATLANNFLGSVNQAITRGLMTFSRPSAAWGVGRSGYLEQFAANVPRLVYDPVSRLTCASGVTLTVGVKYLTTDGGYTYAAGSVVAITSASDPSRWAMARVRYHAGTRLIVEIYRVGGGLGTATGGCVIVKALGYLAEPARSNLITQSNALAAFPWGGTASATDNAAPGGDGTMSASRIVEAAGNTTHHRHYSFSGSPSTTYTFSLDATPAERSVLTLLMLSNGGVYCSAHYDLSSGAVVIGANNLGVVAAMAPSANGRWELSLTATLTADAASSYVRVLLASSMPAPGVAIQFYTGDGVSGLYVESAQLEVGAFRSSRIKTAGSVVTRGADNMNNTPDKLFPAPAALTVIAASQYKLGVSWGGQYGLYNAGSDGKDRAGVDFSATGKLDAFVRSNDVVVASFGSADVMPPYVKSAMCLDGAEARLVANGGAVVKSGAAPMIPFDRIEIGYRHFGDGLCAPLESLTLIPQALSQAEQIARTTL